MQSNQCGLYCCNLLKLSHWKMDKYGYFLFWNLNTRNEKQSKTSKDGKKKDWICFAINLEDVIKIVFSPSFLNLGIQSKTSDHIQTKQRQNHLNRHLKQTSAQTYGCHCIFIPLKSLSFSFWTFQLCLFIFAFFFSVHFESYDKMFVAHANRVHVKKTKKTLNS